MIGQIKEYKKINDKLRKRLAKKDRKMTKIREDLKECLSHRAKLEKRNARMRQWLLRNAVGWEEVLQSSEDEKNTPPCPPVKKRAGIPARGQRTAAVHQLSPASSESKKSGRS